MSDRTTTYREIINAFGCPQLAQALSKPYATVASWRQRDVIPSAFWEDVVAEAKRRGLGEVSLAQLAAIEASRKRPRQVARKSELKPDFLAA